MKSFLPLILLAPLVVGVSCASVKESEMKVNELTCEYQVDPLGIDQARPRLAWKVESGVRGQKQTACRIIVSSSREKLEKNVADLWDSGKVESDETTQISYGGSELVSRQQCFWKVKCWDAEGLETAFSVPALWSMGLLSPSDWQAQWIGMKVDSLPGDDSMPPGPPAPYLRKGFSLDKPVKRATAYVTARGLFDLYLNGKRVSDEVFSPGWTDYNIRIQYSTYDVTEQLLQGDNAIGAVLADGWYSGYIGWSKRRTHYGYQNSFLCQLEVEYADGTSERILSDDGWRCRESDIVSSDLLNGEALDARKEVPGWATASFDDGGWDKVIIAEPTQAKLVHSASPPVRITEYVKPVEITEPEPGVFVFDLGQNFAGWARLKVNGEAGTEVTLRFVERLNPDGTIYTTNLRSAKATDTFILKGGGEEVFEPRFTFHGFQYVEVRGYPGTPGTDAITGCVVNSDLPLAGRFECSDPRINKLWENTLWGQRSNFISIPTDCPQRDERLGWMGDAQIFVRTATLNMDGAGFFIKWMIDVTDDQSSEGGFTDVSPQMPWGLEQNLKDINEWRGAAPGWGDAGVIVPWTIYRVYGDTRIIEEHFESMQRWMDFIYRANPDFLRTNRLFSNYGDWLSIDADTPKDILATAYWAYDANLMSKMAAVIGREKESEEYAQLFEKIKAAFRSAYIKPDGSMPADTQTAYLLALFMELMPEELRAAAADNLVDNIRRHDWHLTTGFLGVRQLNLVLTATGHADVAYRLLFTDTFPSWLYPIKNGATTIWERWDGWTEENGFQDPGMNSFNHYSLGSVTEWLYRYVAGIDLDPKVPGYKQFVIHPYIGEGLDYARAEYNSIHGMIASGWTKEGDVLTLKIVIPANTTAKVYVPCSDAESVTESGVPAAQATGVSPQGWGDGFVVYAVESGEYSFSSKIGE